jgi:hypothetical protein
MFAVPVGVCAAGPRRSVPEDGEAQVHAVGDEQGYHHPRVTHANLNAGDLARARMFRPKPSAPSGAPRRVTGTDRRLGGQVLTGGRGAVDGLIRVFCPAEGAHQGAGMFASVESPVGTPACRPEVPRATTFRSTSGSNCCISKARPRWRPVSISVGSRIVTCRSNRPSRSSARLRTCSRSSWRPRHPSRTCGGRANGLAFRAPACPRRDV